MIDLLSLHQLLSPLPDLSVVKALQLLAWSAACGDISLALDATTVHQFFTKVSATMLISLQAWTYCCVVNDLSMEVCEVWTLMTHTCPRIH